MKIVGNGLLVLSLISVSFSGFAVSQKQKWLDLIEKYKPITGPKEVPAEPNYKKVVAYFPNYAIYARNYTVHNNLRLVAPYIDYIIYSFAIPDASAETINFFKWSGHMKTDKEVMQFLHEHPNLPAMAGLGDTNADVDKIFEYHHERSKCWPKNKENDLLKGNIGELQKLKREFPHLKILLSVGGWTYRKLFKHFAEEGKLDALAQSCIKLLSGVTITEERGPVSYDFNGVFDGLDVDWEFDSPPSQDKIRREVQQALEEKGRTISDGQVESLVQKCIQLEVIKKKVEVDGYAYFLEKLREKIEKDNLPYFLVTALQIGPLVTDGIYEESDYQGLNFEKKDTALNFPRISHVVNWINCMTYNFHGAWNSVTGFNAPLHGEGRFNVATAIADFKKKGAPSQKLVLGIPFYGRTFAGVVAGETHGLGQTFKGAASGDILGKYGAGSINYQEVKRYLLTNETTGKDGYRYYWDKKSCVPWLYNAANQVFVSYDDVRSIQKKVDYALKEKLGGIMYWEVCGDTKDGELVRTIGSALGRRAKNAHKPAKK